MNVTHGIVYTHQSISRKSYPVFGRVFQNFAVLFCIPCSLLSHFFVLTSVWVVIQVYGFISPQFFWFFFYPFAFQAERILSLPGSAHLSMRVFVRTITHPFFLSRVTKFAPDTHPGILSVGIENSGHWNWLSRSIWPVWILGNLVCLRNSFQWIWDTITTFAPNMDLGILSTGFENGGQCPGGGVGIENSGHWNWLSRSIWPVWILGNLVCLRNSFQWIWDTITAFAPNMDLGILSTGFENGGQCPGGGGGGYSVRFRIGMLLTARWLETLLGWKRGRNYTFCPILMKNRGRNTTFSSFLLKYRSRNSINFPETWNRGVEWRSIYSNLHRVSTPPRESNSHVCPTDPALSRWSSYL